MEHKLPINAEDRKVLAEARKTYGPSNQMLVTIEELGELGKVCCKYPRYDDPSTAQEKLHDQAVDEVTDVIIVLDHVFALFGIDWEEVVDRIPIKVDRVRRWLNKSHSMEQTIKDRKLNQTKAECHGCAFEKSYGKSGRCKTCTDQSGYIAKASFSCDSCKHKGDFSNLAPGGVCYTCVIQNGSMYEPIEENCEDEPI